MSVDRTCGCFGCSDPLAAFIDHPKHGQRAVCETHIDGHDVVRRVADE